MEYRYHLAKYAGKSSRLTCPQCERPHCFTPYVDDDNNLIDKTVGRCDHESSCGYHLTPSQYFQQHPEARPQGEVWRQAPAWLTEKRNSVPLPTNFLPEDLVAKTVRLNPVSNFLAFLYRIFDADTVQMLVDRYRLGVTRDGAAIFYQIDLEGRIRTGKIIQYNPETGHRIKDASVPVDWVHARLKKKGLLPESWTVRQCLFGEHLLAQYPDALVCLVEAEKTAVICSAFCPKFIWLATGGKTQLGDRLDVLKGRKVLVFPDIDAYAAWREAFAKKPFLSVTFSDILEKEGTPEDRAAQIDIADWLLQWQSNCCVPSVPLVPERNTAQPEGTNPVLAEVARYFSPESLPEVAALIEDLDLEIISIIPPENA